MWWPTPVTQALQEVEMGELQVKPSHGKKTLSEKETKS
jgi:hypothetical protein